MVLWRASTPIHSQESLTPYVVSGDQSPANTVSPEKPAPVKTGGDSLKHLFRSVMCLDTFDQQMIFRPELVPSRVAPAAIILQAVS